MMTPDALPRSPLCRYLARALLLLLVPLVLLVFQDYGVSNDELVQSTYGRLLLDYYRSGFSNDAALHYLDLYRYGGAFDMIAALLVPLSPFGEYETRHLLGGLLGLVGLLGAWRLGRLLGGDRAGLLALVLLLLTPCFIGHSFTNPKDAPFATAMLWAVYAIVRVQHELPRPSAHTLTLLGVTIGLALSVRVGAILLGPYLALGVLLWLAGRWRAGERPARLAADAARVALRCAPAFVLAYVVMGVFWPYAWQSPLNPLKTLGEFSHVAFPIETLAAGEWYPVNAIPRWYVPAYLVFTLPEIVLAGLASGLAFALLRLRHRWPMSARAQSLYVLGTAGVLPVLIAVALHTTAYNGLRHFLFVVPPLVVCAALALERMHEMLAARAPLHGRLHTLALAALLAVQAGILGYLHPHQYIYYNVLIGGVPGAADRWELDYWGNSLPEAIDGLAEYLTNEYEGAPIARRYRVAVCGKEESARYYFPDFLVFEPRWESADFLIALTNDGCDEQLRLPNAVEIDRFGVPLSVVKDLRGYVLEYNPAFKPHRSRPKFLLYLRRYGKP